MRHLIISIALLAGLAACETSRPASTPVAATPTAPAASTCATPSLELAIGPVGGGQCGNRVCGKGTFCCNESCGICAPIGGGCTQQYCATEAPTDDAELLAIGGTCGGVTCGKGTYCCNASCGRCVPKGMNCTQESCN